MAAPSEDDDDDDADDSDDSDSDSDSDSEDQILKDERDAHREMQRRLTAASLPPPTDTPLTDTPLLDKLSPIPAGDSQSQSMLMSDESQLLLATPTPRDEGALPPPSPSASDDEMPPPPPSSDSDSLPPPPDSSDEIDDYI